MGTSKIRYVIRWWIICDWPWLRFSAKSKNISLKNYINLNKLIKTLPKNETIHLIQMLWISQQFYELLDGFRVFWLLLVKAVIAAVVYKQSLYHFEIGYQVQSISNYNNNSGNDILVLIFQKKGLQSWWSLYLISNRFWTLV